MSQILARHPRRTLRIMVGVITAVLAGAEAGIAVLAGFDAPAVAMAVGGLVALGALSGMMLYRRRT